MSAWAGIVATWKMHARTVPFRRRVASTLRLIREIEAEQKKLFLSLSGGKDSTALAGLLDEAEVPVHAVYVHSELNTPGTAEQVDALQDLLGFGLDVYEPEESVWDLLAMEPDGAKDPLFDRASAGSLLVAYTYEHDWDGAWTGLRASESKGRTMNARTRGALYQLKTDQKWIAQPLLWWTAQDVLAYIASRDLPLHPHYQIAFERARITPERARVDSLVTPGSIHTHGAHAVARMLYPDLWSRIEAARPSLQHTR